MVSRLFDKGSELRVAAAQLDRVLIIVSGDTRTSATATAQRDTAGRGEARCQVIN